MIAAVLASSAGALALPEGCCWLSIPPTLRVAGGIIEEITDAEQDKLIAYSVIKGKLLPALTL